MFPFFSISANAGMRTLPMILGLMMICAAIGSRADHADLLSRSLGALRRSLQYMEDHLSEINLDGSLGCRLAAEHLQMFVAANPGIFQVLGEDVRQALVRLQQKASLTVRQSLPFLKTSDPVYFEQLGALLYQSENLVWYSSRTTDPAHREDPLICLDSAWIESASDRCMREIVGTQSPLSQRCNISDHCVTFMTRPLQREYTLTHQVLFLQLLEAGNCMPHVKSLNAEKLLRLRDYLCANVLRDAERIAAARFPGSHQDLFMEQVGLCGQWGYSDFYRSEWLEAVLSWQTADGCFSRAVPWQCFDSLTPDPPIRKKRNEKRLSDGCYSHKTAVAALALTAFVRFSAERATANYLLDWKPWQSKE